MSCPQFQRLRNRFQVDSLVGIEERFWDARSRIPGG